MAEAFNCEFENFHAYAVDRNFLIDQNLYDEEEVYNTRLSGTSKSMNLRLTVFSILPGIFYVIQGKYLKMSKLNVFGIYLGETGNRKRKIFLLKGIMRVGKSLID